MSIIKPFSEQTVRTSFQLEQYYYSKLFEVELIAPRSIMHNFKALMAQDKNITLCKISYSILGAGT